MGSSAHGTVFRGVSPPCIRILGFTVGQDGPDDSYMFVRDRNEGLVVAGSTMQIEDPLLDSRRLSASRLRATCKVERAPCVSSPRKVAVTAFGDHAEALFAAGAVLLGNETGPGSDLASVLEVARIRHGGDQRACSGRQHRYRDV